MNKRFCVFCGSNQIQKNLEHIIPLWLIELTGDPKRKIKLGFDYRTKKERVYSFDNFKFPACEKCNSNYSTFEAKSKIVILKVLSNEPLESHEINLLLDWLDKVRIGLWLAFNYLDENPYGIDPNFHIADRIGRHDRMLVAYKINDDWKGVIFQGVNLPDFQYIPSCFMLRINNMYFLNLSYEFLFSARVGFPFPVNRVLARDPAFTHLLVHGNMQSGIERYKYPLLRKTLIEPSIKIYQPMIPYDVKGQYPDYYDNDYVSKYCHDINKGIGRIFIENDCQTKIMDINIQNISFNKCLSGSSKYNDKRLNLQVLNMQEYLREKIELDTSNLSKKDKDIVKRDMKYAKRFNELIRKKIQDH